MLALVGDLEISGIDLPAGGLRIAGLPAAVDGGQAAASVHFAPGVIVERPAGGHSLRLQPEDHPGHDQPGDPEEGGVKVAEFFGGARFAYETYWPLGPSGYVGSLRRSNFHGSSLWKRVWDFE